MWYGPCKRRFIKKCTPHAVLSGRDLSQDTWKVLLTSLDHHTGADIQLIYLCHGFKGHMVTRHQALSFLVKIDLVFHPAITWPTNKKKTHFFFWCSIIILPYTDNYNELYAQPWTPHRYLLETRHVTCEYKRRWAQETTQRNFCVRGEAAT